MLSAHPTSRACKRTLSQCASAKRRRPFLVVPASAFSRYAGHPLVPRTGLHAWHVFRNGTHILRNLIQESTEHEAYRARDVLREPLAAGGGGGREGNIDAEMQAEDGSQTQPRMLLLTLQVAFGACACVRRRVGWEFMCVRACCVGVDVDAELYMNSYRNQVEVGHNVRQRVSAHL